VEQYQRSMQTNSVQKINIQTCTHWHTVYETQLHQFQWSHHVWYSTCPQSDDLLGVNVLSHILQ